tara:strand:+ start:1466 stop:1663 length:198 start_codon:yes stop_codon:yes gene_type:complete
MAHEFVILKDGVLLTFDKYEDIPSTFDNLIKFAPEIPPGPHTDTDHEEIERWNEKLLALRPRETR